MEDNLLVYGFVNGIGLGFLAFIFSYSLNQCLNFFYILSD